MQSWGLSDQGCVRKQNQDAFHIEKLDRNTQLCVVCDGMGGAKSGNIASTLTVDVFVQEVKRSWTSKMKQPEIERMLRSAVKLANFTVHDQSRQFEEFDGMGTTLVAVLVQNRTATVIHVGDSRAYHVGPGGIRQLTRDHSLVQMMVERGELTPEMARTYPGKNFITRAIGTEAVAQCDVFVCKLKKKGCIFLCTDGLTNLLDEQEILFEVAHEEDKAQCCQRLLDIAKRRGAPDTVTSILVEI